MKNSKLHGDFAESIREKLRSLSGVKKGDLHVFTINANYGRYKVVIGPVKKRGTVPLEIDGEIHHLFISPDAVRPNPTKDQVRDNLRHMVLMRNLAVHIDDPTGDGNLAVSRSRVKAREYINLAGREGCDILKIAGSRGRLSHAAYDIIQRDILSSWKKSHRKGAHQ